MSSRFRAPKVSTPSLDGLLADNTTGETPKDPTPVAATSAPHAESEQVVVPSAKAPRRSAPEPAPLPKRRPVKHTASSDVNRSDTGKRWAAAVGIWTDADLAKISQLSKAYKKPEKEILKLVAKRAIDALTSSLDDGTLTKPRSLPDVSRPSHISYPSSFQMTESQFQALREVFDPIGLLKDRAILTQALSAKISETLGSM